MGKIHVNGVGIGKNSWGWGGNEDNFLLCHSAIDNKYLFCSSGKVLKTALPNMLKSVQIVVI